MMELLIAFILSVCALLLLAEDETLEELAERRWIMYLADQSRKRRPQSARQRCRYIQAGYIPGKGQVR